MKPWYILVSFFVGSLGRDFKLTILHTNDIHARIDEFDAFGSRCTAEASEKKQCYGGIARQKYKVDSIRRSNPNTLFLNSGDFYQGTIWYFLFKGKVIADTIDILKHDAITLGNHEFDDGSKGLFPLLEGANHTGTPVLGCNVDFSRNPFLKHFQPLPSIILKRSGVNIGLIGYLTPQTSYLSSVDSGSVITDEIQCIRREASKLHRQGVKIIIAMGHSGYVKDQQIAAEVPLVQLVVGAHSHTYLSSVDQHQTENPKGPYPTVITRSDGTKALVVQDFWLGKYLGYINVTFDSESGEIKGWEGDSPLLLDYTVPKDEEVENFVQYIRVSADARSNELIGDSIYTLSGDADDCRFNECALGNLLADAVINYFINMDDSPALPGIEPPDIVVINGGAIRATLPKGKITFQDIVAVSPFANPLWVLPMNGQQVIRMFEHGLKEYDSTHLYSSGGFLQTSGARLIANVDRPPMERILSVKVWCWKCEKPDWQEVDPKKIYRVAMSSYVALGGDKHNFTDIAESEINKLTITDLQVAIAHVRRYSPLHPITDGRLQIISRCNKGIICQSASNGVALTASLGYIIWIISTVTAIHGTKTLL